MRWLFLIAKGLGVAGCKKHALILPPNPAQELQSPGFVCEPGPTACRKDTTNDPAWTNQSRTTRFQLPDCPRGVGQVYGENANRGPACWEALADAGISFTCHWGQEYGMDHARLRAYYGDPRIDAWLRARDRLLSSAEAKAVFTTPLLRKMGLG